MRVLRPVLAVFFIALAVAVTGMFAGSRSGYRVEFLSSAGPADIPGTACLTRVDGHETVVPLGQGVRDGAEWRNCVAYDGHPVIVHSAVPPGRAG